MSTHLNLVLVCDLSSGSKNEAPKGHDPRIIQEMFKITKEEEERKNKARKKCLKSYSKKIK